VGATPLPLIGDRPRPAAKSYRGTRGAWAMPPDVLRAVSVIGEREGVTLYICHLAALCALLFRYTGRPDVTVTTVLSTRERVAGGEAPTAATQAGVFVNPVLLRCRWEGDVPFAALLRLARSATLDAQHGKDVPVTAVLRSLGWAGGALPPLLGQINLSAGTPPVEGRSGAGLQVEGMPRRGIKSEGDLGLFALGDPQARIEVQVEYDTDMFDGQTAERLWEHLRTVLLRAAADTSTPLSAVLSGVGPLVRIPDMHDRLVALLDSRQASYRVLDHEAEGRSDRIAAIRGNRPEEGAKAMVIRLQVSKRGRAHCLAVLPGNRRIDLARLSAECGARSATLASREVAVALTGCEPGAIPPFSFHEELPLIVDSALLQNDEIVFNAGRLDRSIRISSRTYVDVAAPRIAAIAQAG
jgi:Ala-tRNA(Pro) deacylase